MLDEVSGKTIVSAIGFCLPKMDVATSQPTTPGLELTKCGVSFRTRVIHKTPELKTAEVRMMFCHVIVSVLWGCRSQDSRFHVLRSQILCTSSFGQPAPCFFPAFNDIFLETVLRVDRAVVEAFRAHYWWFRSPQ